MSSTFELKCTIIDQSRRSFKGTVPDEKVDGKRSQTRRSTSMKVDS